VLKKSLIEKQKREAKFELHTEALVYLDDNYTGSDDVGEQGTMWAGQC
jgi:hypothetical protein